MAAGSLLFVFCLCMISISQPQQWYQVGFNAACSYAYIHLFKLFLAQGIGLGFAIGSTYVPALGIVAHHFKRKRSLAMGIVASASSVGGVVHPIMLNQLIHGRIGFHWGVRASALLNFILLIIANCIMTSRLPPQNKSFSNQVAAWRIFFQDTVYVVATAGTFLLITGVFFPTFYLQFNAIEHGVSPVLAFYTVSHWIISGP